MKKMILAIAILAFCVALGASAVSPDRSAAANTGFAKANSPAPAITLCPGGGFECPDVWDPVICDGGRVFSNGCFASQACATGCRPLSIDS